MHCCVVPAQKPEAPGWAFAHEQTSPSVFVPPPLVPLVPLVPPLVVPLEPVSFGHTLSKFVAVSEEHGLPSRQESWPSVVELQRLEQLVMASAAGSPHCVAFF